MKILFLLAVLSSPNEIPVQGITPIIEGQYFGTNVGPVLDPEVFYFDTNRGVVTLTPVGRWTNDMQSFKPRIITTIGQTRYVKLSVALSWIVGMIVGVPLGIWFALRKTQ